MRDFLFYKLHDNRFTRPVKRLIVRLIATGNASRRALNHYYGSLGAEARANFYMRYAKVFRQRGVSMSPGEWKISFVGREILLPLRTSWSWLDWDNAVSIVGHDIEVKETYAALVESDQRPSLFLDIGANYGTHSVLFLSAGVPVIAFEPNPSCSAYFETVCKINGLSGRWEQVAIGRETGELELIYSEKDTWLGSVSVGVSPKQQGSGDMASVRVPVRNLDYYFNDIPHGKILIKIDVEGYEYEVLKGASQVLHDCMPTIIFESNGNRERNELFHLLAGFGYCVHLLPWRPSGDSQSLDAKEFVASTAVNFIAIPQIQLV
jgi:FkbM family methyltransferase